MAGDDDEDITKRSGGTDTSIESDNASAEMEAGSGAPEPTMEELQQMMEEELDTLNQDISELKDLYENEANPEIKAELLDEGYHLQADARSTAYELKALKDHGFVGSIDNYIENEAGVFGGSGVFVPIDEQTGFQRLRSVRHFGPRFIANVSGLDILEPGPLDLIPGGQLRRLGRLKRIAQGTRRVGARRRAAERIKSRRRRRNRRRCKSRGGNPVFLDSGAISQADPAFTLPGLFGVVVASTYQSDLTHLRGPLGWGRVSDLDATLERLPNTKLRYIDGAGFSIDFDRPTPNIGQWNAGDHIRHMEIAAGRNRTFLIKEEGIIRHFTKHSKGQWHLAAIENTNGAKLLFERDLHGMLNAMETPEGLRLECANDSERQLRLSIDLVGLDGSRKTIMRYRYDNDDNLILAECPYGDKHEYSYNRYRQRVWARHNDQYEASYYFDKEGRCVLEETNGPYHGTRFEYDPERGITKHIPGGDSSKTEVLYYHDDGSVFAETHIDGSIKRTYYDDEGNTICEQDGNGHRTQFTYDPWGNIQTITDPEGRISDFRWTADGQMEFAIDPTGACWESDYDERGNLIGTKDDSGSDIRITNNAMGQATDIHRHDDKHRYLDYTDNHWLVKEIGYDGLETRFEHDHFGRVTAIIEAEQRITEYRYVDQEGWSFWNPCEVIVQGDTLTKTDVINPRRQLRQTDGSGRQTYYEIDGFGKVEATQDAEGGTLQFRYDREEELTEVENQTGQVWRFERDARGRIVKETDFGGSVICYEYDDGDRLTASTYPDGTRHEIVMDKSGLITKETVLSPDQDALITTYQYDDRGLLAQAKNNDATIDFERNKVGQVIAEITNGVRIENHYNRCGRRISRTINGETVHYTYEAGHLSELAIGKYAPLLFNRDALGHETTRQSATGFQLQQQYNALGLLLNQQLKRPGATRVNEGIIERQYTWNHSFEPVNIQDKRWHTTHYHYNHNGQITQTIAGYGDAESFAYDQHLNIAATAFHNVGAKKIREISELLSQWKNGEDGRVQRAKGPQGETISLTYDQKGRVTTRTIMPSNFRNQTWHFEWNGLDRLTIAHTPEGSKWAYGYDAFGRRIYKQQWIKATLKQPDGTTAIEWQQGKRHDFLWDGDVIAQESITDKENTTNTVQWYFEPDSFVPIARKENDNLSYVITDHLGTPREVVAEDGTLEWAAQYRTWGGMQRLWHNVESKSANTSVALEERDNPDLYYCPIRFQGQWEDEETGLYYNRFRYYEPLVAGYLSADPIGLLGGKRSLGYVRSPINDVDPNGLNAALRRALGLRVRDSMQAHHLIPKEIWGINRNFLNQIGMGDGRDLAANGVGLPNNQQLSHRLGKPYHCGSHPVYSTMVQGRLSNIAEQFAEGDLTAAQARTAVGNLQSQLRREILALPGGTRIF